MAMMTTILVLEKDLFFTEKIRDTLKHHDMHVVIARNLATFEQRLATTGDEKPGLVIVNTAIVGVDWEQAIRVARQRAFPVLAFGSHMDLEARAKALQAGAQKVVANSKFSSDMPGLVQRMLAHPLVTTADTSDTDTEE